MRFLSLAALSLILFCTTPAQATETQMLPPMQSSNMGTPCSSSEGDKILTWDGETAIKCNDNATIDSAGNLDIKGGAKITSGVQIGNDFNCIPAKAGTMRWNGADKEMNYCDGSLWKNFASLPNINCPTGQVLKGITSGAPVCIDAYTNCQMKTGGTRGEMLTLACPSGKRLVSGSCWRRSSGTFIGTHNYTNSYQCRIEGSRGLDIWITCCD